MPFASKTAFIGGTATLPPPQPVSPPLNLTGSAGDRAVTLRWVPSPSPNTTAVRVYRDEQLVATLGPTVTTYRNSGLTNGQSYRYNLEAVRNEVVSKRTDVLTLTPTALNIDIEPPTTFRAAKRDGGVRLFWVPSITEDVEGIYVYQDGVIVATATPDATTTAVYGLTNGQSYSFRLAAFMGGGVSVQTEADNVVPGAELIAIEPPTVTGVAGDGKVTLRWTRSTTSGVSSYEIYLFNQFIADAGNVTSYTLNDLTNGEHYTCKVLAYKNGDRSLTTDDSTYEGYPRAKSPEPDPIENLSPYSLECLDVGDWRTSLFSGDRLTFAQFFDAYPIKAKEAIVNTRQADKSWNGSYKTWPKNCYNSKGDRVSFGAYDIQRRTLSGRSNRIYFAAMLSKHPVYVDLAYQLLDKLMGLLYMKGSVNHYDDNDGWLGWRYGTGSGTAYVKEDRNKDGVPENYENLQGIFLPLENALHNGLGQMPYLLWINRNTRTAGGYSTAQKLTMINKARAYFKLHHTPRWIENRDGVQPTPSNPTLTERNFAHADMSQASSDLAFAQLETDMYNNNYRTTVTVDMPDGFDDQKVSLESGTSSDVRTHPYYKRALWTFTKLRTVKVGTGVGWFTTAYGDDIRNSDMRRWYGDCGASYWGQRTIKTDKQFTANSGYNGLTFPGIAHLFLGGVIRDSFGSQTAAIRFMQGCAGGASHMLPERLRTAKYQYCFVFDDPKNSSESNAYLYDGAKKRPFGGRATETTTTSSNRETANNWDTDPVGIFGAWDPSGRLGQVNVEMRRAAGNLRDKPGTTISRWLESLGKEHNPEWSKRY